MRFQYSPTIILFRTVDYFGNGVIIMYELLCVIYSVSTFSSCRILDVWDGADAQIISVIYADDGSGISFISLVLIFSFPRYKLRFANETPHKIFAGNMLDLYSLVSIHITLHDFRSFIAHLE